MRAWMAGAATALALLGLPLAARGHCDAVDGPVATAAVKALDAGNVNIALPYAPAEAEAEITGAFRQAMIVRTKGVDAKALADRFFMETVVRLHRHGEHAPYTGLKAAGRDHGPAIPAAERAIASRNADALLALLHREVSQAVSERFSHLAETPAVTAAPTSAGEVAAARRRVTAELGFIGYVEALYQATRGATHTE